MRERGTDAIPETHTAGDALDPGAGQYQRARRDIHHAIDRTGIERWAFALHRISRSPAESIASASKGSAFRFHTRLSRRFHQP